MKSITELIKLDHLSILQLTVRFSPASAEEKQKTPAFVKQLALSSDGASKNKSSRSTLESAEEIMKKNSPPPPLVAHPEASDENLEPKGGVYIDDQLDRRAIFTDIYLNSYPLSFFKVN